MLQYKSTRRTGQNCSPRVVNTCAVCWPQQSTTLRHCRPRGAVLPSPLFASILLLSLLFSDGHAAAQPHRAGDRRRAPPRRLLRGGARLRARPFPQLLRLPGRLAPPPWDPRSLAPHHRAGPSRVPRRGLPRRRGRAARAAAKEAPRGILRGGLRRVRRRVEGARHGRVREDAARRPHAPGLLLRPRRQWPRSCKLECKRQITWGA